jgi:hypothetical protein
MNGSTFKTELGHHERHPMLHQAGGEVDTG